MLRIIEQERCWWKTLAEGEIDISTLAACEGVTASWMVWVSRLAFLAPDIIEMLVQGRQPVMLDGKALTAPGVVSLRWTEQRQRLGAAV